MINIYIGSIFFAHCYFLRVFHEVFRNSFYCRRHGSAEEPGAFTINGIFQNKINIIPESHVQHFICFIKHYIFYFLQINRFSFYHVNKPARCSHYYVNPFFKRTYLHYNRSAAIHRFCNNIAAIFFILLQVVTYLQTKFTCGTYD